jgi:hypothetical protein
LNFPAIALSCVLAIALPLAASAQSWMERVSATQAQQPHWMTPVATVTPRLEQEFRFDVLHQVTPSGDVTNLDGGKGLELIPTRRTELLINLPPYLVHENAATSDGWGDASFTLKYRFFARPEKEGNAIVTGFLGGSVPAGQFKNGSISAIVTPTLAAGKGWGWFDVQSTLAGTFPVNSVNQLGRSIVSNTAFQTHVLKKLWPELEINSTAWAGGDHDGKKQTFLTPGINFGRFRVHKRVALVGGLGFQIAATHYHQYNHGLIATLRMPF